MCDQLDVQCAPFIEYELCGYGLDAACELKLERLVDRSHLRNAQVSRDSQPFHVSLLLSAIVRHAVRFAAAAVTTALS